MSSLVLIVICREDHSRALCVADGPSDDATDVEARPKRYASVSGPIEDVTSGAAFSRPRHVGWSRR